MTWECEYSRLHADFHFFRRIFTVKVRRHGARPGGPANEPNFPSCFWDEYMYIFIGMTSAGLDRGRKMMCIGDNVIDIPYVAALAIRCNRCASAFARPTVARLPLRSCAVCRAERTRKNRNIVGTYERSWVNYGKLTVHAEKCAHWEAHPTELNEILVWAKAGSMQGQITLESNVFVVSSKKLFYGYSRTRIFVWFNRKCWSLRESHKFANISREFVKLVQDGFWILVSLIVQPRILE